MTDKLVYRLFASNEWNDRGTPIEDYRGKFTDTEAAEYLRTNDYDIVILTDDDLQHVAEQTVEIIPDTVDKRTRIKLLLFTDGKRVVISKVNQTYLRIGLPPLPFGTTGNYMPGMWKDDTE